MKQENFLATSASPLDGTLPSVNIFKGVQGYERKLFKFDGHTMPVDIILYAAKVIGTTLSAQCNGIAIVLPQSHSIVALDLFKEESGRIGASTEQINEFNRLKNIDDYAEFADKVNSIAEDQKQLREPLTLGMVESCA